MSGQMLTRRSGKSIRHECETCVNAYGGRAQWVRPPYGTQQRPASSLFRRNADDLDAGTARLVHREDHRVVLHHRVALHEDDLLRAGRIQLLEALVESGLLDRDLVDL